jgi:periplasmic divalent cation tolerance protein
MTYCLVCTLTNSKEEALKIAHSLVKAKLAACCNVIDGVTSVYEWKGEICEDGEFFVMIKTRKALFDEVKAHIKSLHSYELPAIYMLPIETGLQEFLDWIKQNTTP